MYVHVYRVIVTNVDKRLQLCDMISEFCVKKIHASLLGKRPFRLRRSRRRTYRMARWIYLSVIYDTRVWIVLVGPRTSGRSTRSVCSETKLRVRKSRSRSAANSKFRALVRFRLGLADTYLRGVTPSGHLADSIRHKGTRCQGDTANFRRRGKG